MGKKEHLYFQKGKVQFSVGTKMLRDETKKAWLRLHARPF